MFCVLSPLCTAVLVLGEVRQSEEKELKKKRRGEAAEISDVEHQFGGY